MATRRRGADLEELRARLNTMGGGEGGEGAADDGGGIGPEGSSEGTESTSPTSPPPVVPGGTLAMSAFGGPPPAAADAPAARPAASAPPGPAFGASTPASTGFAGSSPAPASPAPPARPAAPSPAPTEKKAAPTMSAAELDLSSAVAEKDVESYTLTEGEVASLGGGGKFPLAVVLAAITALFLGVFFGWAGGSGMSARQLINQRIDNAGTLSAEVTNVSKQLAALHAQLDTIAVDTGYRPEFDDALRAAFTGDKRPVLSGDAVAAARVVLAYDARLSGQLIDFSVGTQIFAATVDRHLAQARAEVEEIQREAEGKEDPRGYGILFNFDEQAARYQQYLDNTQAPSFLPVPGLRVRFGELTLVTNEKGGSFTIDLPNGQQQAVPAYNLIVVDKGQLVEGTTTEPASARHARRARQIKEQLAALVEAQGRIGKQLDELSAAPKVFVFP